MLVERWPNSVIETPRRPGVCPGVPAILALLRPLERSRGRVRTIPHFGWAAEGPI